MRSVLIVFLAMLSACGKGDKQKCDAGCRNFASLMYWKPVDVEIAKLPPEQQDAERKKRLGEVTSKIELGIDFCVSKCQAANNDDQADCMVKAKTYDQAKACVDD